MREPMERMYGAEAFSKLWSDWVDIREKIVQLNKGDICSKDLCKITAPTLLLHGGKDPMIYNVHGQFLKKHIKNSE